MRNPPNGKYSTDVVDVWGATSSNKTRAGIHFNIEGMKPRTNVYPFFDGTDISSMIRPAIIIKVALTANLAVYGTSTGNWEGGARDLSATFSGNDTRSTVTLSTSTVTGNDAKCLLVLKSADASSIYWHVVPQSRSSTLYDVTVISDFTGGGTAGTIAVDGTSMVITGLTRAKKAGSLRARTDATGGVGGIFEVPVNTFSTGSRSFLMADNISGTTATAKTYAKKNFEASGMTVEVQEKIQETRTPVRVATPMDDEVGAAITQVSTVSY